MRPVPALLLTGAGAVVLCASGCFGPMYGPNGPYGPGYSSYSYPAYGAPTMGSPGSFQTLTPGPQYTPGIYNSGATSPTPTPTYNNGGDAAPYNGGSTSPVPTPADTPYFLPNSGASNDQGGEAVPFSGLDTPQVSQAGSGDRAAFDGSTPVWPVGYARTADASGKRSDGYGHDAARYQWLEGVVSYDASDRTWNVVYDLDPADGDQYAGHFTLSDSPLLRTFREGERVRLEGSVDAGNKDRFGKPTYLLERIIRNAA
ncbi:MAG: hypothetical protein ACK5Q5_09645 [Planctomycetaceae bacterium]